MMLLSKDNIHPSCNGIIGELITTCLRAGGLAAGRVDGSTGTKNMQIGQVKRGAWQELIFQSETKIEMIGVRRTGIAVAVGYG